MLEHLSFASAPRPFKDPNYRKNATRRNKTLKQIVAGERIRARQVANVQTANLSSVVAAATGTGNGEGGSGSGTPATDDVAMQDADGAGLASGATTPAGKLRPGTKVPPGQSKKAKAAEAAAGPVGIASEADYLACTSQSSSPTFVPVY